MLRRVLTTRPGERLVVLAVGDASIWLDADGDPPLGVVDTTATARVKELFVMPENY